MLTDDELLAGYYGPSLPRPRPAQVTALITHLRAVERAVLMRAASEIERLGAGETPRIVGRYDALCVANRLREQAGGEDGKNTD